MTARYSFNCNQCWKEFEIKACLEVCGLRKGDCMKNSATNITKYVRNKLKEDEE